MANIAILAVPILEFSDFDVFERAILSYICSEYV